MDAERREPGDTTDDGKADADRVMSGVPRVAAGCRLRRMEDRRMLSYASWVDAMSLRLRER